MPRPFVVVVAAVVMVAVAGGCSGGKSDSDLQQIDTALQSWSATIDLIGQQQRARAVPRRYVDQTLKAIEKDLDTQQKQIDQADDPKMRRAAVRDRLEQVRAQFEALRKEHGSGGGGRA